MQINNCNSRVIINKEDVVHGQKYDDHDATKIIAKLNYAGSNELTPPVMKEGNMQSFRCVEMVCGFADSRNLDAKEGVNMFTIDQLNSALGIGYAQFDEKLVQRIQHGIIIDHNMIDKFNRCTNINMALSKKLLQSWSLYLHDHYDFISIKNRLLKRASECIEPCQGCFIYILKKNNVRKFKLSSSLKHAFKRVFTTIMEDKDISGLSILKDYSALKKSKLYSVLKIIFFRRTSKLALKWCNKHRIAVNFDVDFKHNTAMRAWRARYRPITFSEYKFCKKHNLDNVFIRSSHDAEHEAIHLTRRDLNQGG